MAGLGAAQGTGPQRVGAVPAACLPRHWPRSPLLTGKETRCPHLARAGVSKQLLFCFVLRVLASAFCQEERLVTAVVKVLKPLRVSAKAGSLRSVPHCNQPSLSQEHFVRLGPIFVFVFLKLDIPHSIVSFSTI